MKDELQVFMKNKQYWKSIPKEKQRYLQKAAIIFPNVGNTSAIKKEVPRRMVISGSEELLKDRALSAREFISTKGVARQVDQTHSFF